MHSPIRASLRMFLFAAWTLTFVPPYALLLAAGWRHYRALACFYWRVTAWFMGFRVTVHGAPTRQKPALFVSNHASYLDIVILGGLIEAAFVAKSEVATWPGFGTLAKLGRTVFVDRKRGSSAKQRDDMLARLTQEPVIIFPEGTSNDGNRVLPFKSALLSVAEVAGRDQPLPVQPVSIAYTRLDGLPIGYGWRHMFAWYGGMDLAPHLWEVLGLGQTTVEVIFHPEVRLTDFASRKELSEHCWRQVARGVAQANSGRIPKFLPAATESPELDPQPA